MSTGRKGLSISNKIHESLTSHCDKQFPRINYSSFAESAIVEKILRDTSEDQNIQFAQSVLTRIMMEKNKIEEAAIAECLKNILKRVPGMKDFKKCNILTRQGEHYAFGLEYDGKKVYEIRISECLKKYELIPSK